jgi:hypothetical protein
MRNSFKWSRHLRRLALFAPCWLSIFACERPSYVFSDDVPINGAGNTSFGGSVAGGTGPISVAGSLPSDPCALDRSVSSEPIFAKQAISNALSARAELYAQVTDEEAAALRKGGSLIPKPPAAPAPTPTLTLVLTTLSNSVTEPRKTLVKQLLTRSPSSRALWHNPWALRLIDHPGTEHMNLVRVVLRPTAWIVRIYNGSLPTVVGLDNAIVTIEDAIKAPENIAAVYYVYDDRLPGNSTAQCETGKREVALINEGMVEEISLGTSEILERLNSDIEDLTAMFNVVRPCASVDRGFGTFHAYTTCTTWHFFDASTEYSAYQWALSNPVELYKPKTQNLASLVDALKNDRFDPNPYVANPEPPSGGAGEGGMSGAGGAAELAGAGGAGGSPP